MEDKAIQTAADAAAHTDAQEPTMTMEDILNAEAQYKEPARGEVINGTVVFIGSEGIHVDVGAKVEGIIPFSQIQDEPITQEQAQEMFKQGDHVEAYVVRVEPANNIIILSKRRADQDRGWRVLDNLFKEEKSFHVNITEKVRGGLVASIEGVRAFLPASQVDTRRVNDLGPYVDQPLEVRLIELNKKRNRVIISHRVVMEERKSKARAETMSQLVPGAILDGEVVEITDFGVFVNLGGLDGLVHRSELTHARFNHPKEVMQLGDKVKVKVLDLDDERERINLSIKALTHDPWEASVEKYNVSDKIRGKVTNITNFGAFVEIETGLEGLIHVSEMSWTKRVRHPQEVLALGDEVEAMILRIDNKDHRVSLGLRQIHPDPWSTLPDRLPPGTRVKGKVTGITDFGLFMEIEEGIEGLIHISELAHERVTNPAELFKRGDEIEAVILNIDPVEQRASLSRKKSLPYDGPARPERDYTRQGGGERGDRFDRGTGSNRGPSTGNRRGRRDGFDYDYSGKDNANASSGKISTKLGDVYADLFAQFGITGKKDETKE